MPSSKSDTGWEICDRVDVKKIPAIVYVPVDGAVNKTETLPLSGSSHKVFAGTMTGLATPTGLPVTFRAITRELGMASLVRQPGRPVPLTLPEPWASVNAVPLYSYVHTPSGWCQS